MKRRSIDNGVKGRPETDTAGRAEFSSVGVISKVLRILEALQSSSVGLNLKAICDDTGINKSTAHRFLKHLERENYLLRTETGSYLIGSRLTQMSTRANMSATLQAVARPVLVDLWRSSVNSFEAPNTVVSKSIAANVQGGKISLQLEPKSVTVVSIEQ